MRNIFFITLSVFIVSCAKTPLLEASEAMVGDWIHFSDEDDSHRVVINADGTGYMEWAVDGNASKSTKMRDWYLDDNTLSFGKVAFNGEAYEIEEYPTVAWMEIINFYDTIPELSRYIILDGNYYVEK